MTQYLNQTKRVKHPDGERVHQFDSTESMGVELASSAGVTVYVLEEDEVVEVDDDHVARS